MPSPDQRPGDPQAHADRRVLVVYRGLPGSGKTTHANTRLATLRAAGIPAARVSRDDVRRTLGLTPGATTEADERQVTAVQAGLIGLLYRTGVLIVLVDNTTLDEQHLADLARLAQACAADVEITDLRNVPVSTCVARDAGRTGVAHLGGSRIHQLAAAAGLAQPTVDTRTAGQ
jgi:adenylylsulfate kinase-like enzyme